MDFKRLPPPYIPSFIVNLNRYLKDLFKASDEALKIDNVVQSTGESTVNVMSQDATTKELNKKLNTAQVVQSTGDSTENVMSQDATTKELTKKLNIAQGAENEGKIPTVNSSGNLEFADAPGGAQLYVNENGRILGDFVVNGVLTTYIFKASQMGTNEPLIPTLTSNTGTNGYVVYGNTYKGSDGDNSSYYAFDDSNSSNCGYYGGENHNNGYIGYIFNEEKLITRFTAKLGNFLAANNFTVKAQYYDGVNWFETGITFNVTGKAMGSYNEYDFTLDEAIFARGFRLFSPTTKTEGTNLLTYNLQVYG